jgi:hypothetical protein
MGLTVILKLVGVPIHVNAEGVTVTTPIVELVPVFIPLKPEIFPVPFPVKPIVVLVLLQL